jgi:hypothetical protein
VSSEAGRIVWNVVVATTRHQLRDRFAQFGSCVACMFSGITLISITITDEALPSRYYIENSAYMHAHVTLIAFGVIFVCLSSLVLGTITAEADHAAQSKQMFLASVSHELRTVRVGERLLKCVHSSLSMCVSSLSRALWVSRICYSRKRNTSLTPQLAR